MNEMDMLKRLGEDFAPVDTTPPVSLRHRALTGGTPAVPHRKRRWQLGMAGVAALSVITAVTFSVAQQQPQPRDGTSQQIPSVLDNAALVARNSDAGQPRPDQYIFTESVSAVPMQMQQPDGTTKMVERDASVTQTWISVDGTRTSTSRQRLHGHSNAWSEMPPIRPCATPTELPNEADPCTSQPGFNKSAPDDGRAMRAWLYAIAQRQQGNSRSPSPSHLAANDPQHAAVFENARDLLCGGTYLTAQQRAALFEALSTVPGVREVKGVRDAAGRAGVGVGLPESDLLIFDAATYAFLGTPETAVLRQAVVEKPGQLPS